MLFLLLQSLREPSKCLMNSHLIAGTEAKRAEIGYRDPSRRPPAVSACEQLLDSANFQDNCQPLHQLSRWLAPLKLPAFGEKLTSGLRLANARSLIGLGQL